MKVQRNFNVSDGLTSISSAVEVVKEARDLCHNNKLHLHKFFSNNKEVIASIPKEECGEGVKDLDMALGELHIERALGVQ